MRLKLFIIIICLCSVFSLFAEVNYRVTASRLNVRKSPSTASIVLGTFKMGQEITVLSINGGWAKVEFNNSVGYVSEKFILPLPKPEIPVKAQEEPKEEKEVVKDDYEEQVMPSREFMDVTNLGNNEIETPLLIGSSMLDAMNLYLALQGGFGWSNFLWGDGSVNGTMAYSGNILAQLYFEDKVSFIPQNWYSEIALGYNKLGAADFDMNYIHVGLCPFGYRIPLNPVNIVVKAGIDLSFPLSDLETYSDSWSAAFQCGVLGGLQVEWKQFAIGCNVIYDFTEVSSSCNQALYNIGILGTLTYKFGKFGHKK